MWEPQSRPTRGMKAGVNFLLLSIIGCGLLPNWPYRTSILLRLEKPLWQSATRVHKEKPQPRSSRRSEEGPKGPWWGFDSFRFSMYLLHWTLSSTVPFLTSYLESSTMQENYNVTHKCIYNFYLF